MIPYAELAIAVVFAAAFASGGEMEARGGRANHGVLWAGTSVLVSALVVFVLGAGYGWLIASQLALFIAIGAVRAWLEQQE